jgi:nucleoside-diphosphate-sugar epimerase
MYVILGATGNTGSVVAENLLAKSEKVRAVGRNKERLAALAKRGAETMEGDISDATLFTRRLKEPGPSISWCRRCLRAMIIVRFRTESLMRGQQR